MENRVLLNVNGMGLGRNKGTKRELWEDNVTVKEYKCNVCVSHQFFRFVYAKLWKLANIVLQHH